MDPEVNPMNSAVFFLLGLYALLTTTNDWPMRDTMLDDYVRGHTQHGSTSCTTDD